ncbi:MULTISPECIES: beta strand repeat-containing protein [unclassified Nostoc]|uniref:beta strand repeat-containing protein n=1 Tax=unclassified Nostoc TaxID=2593658 RepID=UPI002AD5912E|nr:FG-GAP-like repeat-containing protein [Nostoc sp. DedQUE03]MDZ7971217.1 FG-GAP-like repeat-containing protein [Nostoc sp. DedQUE03]MDZ8043387.1 FG-GAP-like repeat-containing protein [Nostoc sp. DedQUE02]
MPTNTAPTLDNKGNPTLVTITQDVTDTDNLGTLVSAILTTGAGGDPILDADTGAVEGIAVIGVDNTHGIWQYSTNGGNNWINFAVSTTSATLLRDTEKVRFIPNAGYNGTAEITFRAWDASDGNASGTTGVNPGVGGGTTAYSTATETATIAIAPLVGLRPYSIVTGDFNKDGKLDLITANKSSQSVSVLLGKGDGTFNPASSFSVVGFNGLNPYSVAVADFNKDGKLDLVTANNSSSNISVLFGDDKATGSFGPASNFTLPSGSSPISVAVGDFNKDGKADIVTANNASQNISVLLGDGIGGFATAKNFKVPSRPTSVIVGDFNGDGKSDLAVTSSYFNNVSILLGNGDGTFNSATQFNVGTNPHSVVIGDFNKDGKSDLAVANSDSNNVSVLLGNGDSYGTFKPATNFNVGLNPVSVTVIDFNGDGKSDLAVANADSNTVSVLLGDGTGSFGNATNFDVGTTPYAVTVGDFDKDGKSDLAVANSESRNVSVLLNNRAESYDPVPPQPILINEIFFDPPSTDGPREYIELRGTPGATLAPGTYLVGIEGDTGSSNPGNVQDIFDLSGKQFGSNGLLVLLQKSNPYVNVVNPNAKIVTNAGTGAGWGSGASSSIGHTGQMGATDIENGSVSFLLIQATTAPTLSNDIDSNDDGIVDGTVYSNWTVLDSVSVLDGTSTTDRAYSSIVFRKGSNGGSVPANATVVDTSFIAGYVGRSGNTTGSTALDWVASAITTGTAPNFALGTVTNTVANTSPGNFAEQPLNHIGDTNFAPAANLNYAISTATPTVIEGNSSSKIVSFTVTRSGNTAIATTVNYVLDGTATSGSDYNNIKIGTVTGTLSGTLKFAVGETTKTISLNVLGEKVTETDETINLNLNYPNQIAAIAPGTITIVDDDNIPAISIVDKSGNESAGNIAFTVQLSNASSEIITVAYNTSNDTAIAGVDYTAVTGSLTFNPGVTTQTITVPILNDFVAESSERFFVNLTNPTNASIGDNQAIGTITDNDTVGFTISPATGIITTEAGGTASFGIQLTSQPTANVTLNLSSSNVNEGTIPVSSVTFTAANWNTPQLITVTGVNDGIADDNIAYKIITGTVVSSDAKYNNFNPANIADIDVINIKNGNQVNSIITGSAKVDNLQGTSSDDLIFGFASNDVIVGGLGNDQIYGGLGADNLTGGAGNDIFVLAKGEGRDTIKDFKTGEDLIGLSAGLLYSGLSLTQSGSDTLIKVTANNESLALLTGITASTLNASNFITLGVN